MANSDRHAGAVARTLQWADAAAERGKIGEALDWIRLVEIMDGGLPPDWKPAKQGWYDLAAVRLTADAAPS